MKEIDPNQPINKIAARVVAPHNEKGVDVNFGSKVNAMVPLPTTQFIGRRQDDLTGRTFGHFTVIGCAVFRPKNWRLQSNSTRWVARCRCGRYQIFTTKAVKKKRDFPIACESCEKTRRLGKLDWAVIDKINSTK